MAGLRHYNIPVFIPELACPHRCVFCNQNTITGIEKAPPPEKVKNIVNQYLKTIPEENSEIEIAFFGGSFTGIPLSMQGAYLQSVAGFIGPRVQGIRLSTRPDYIDDHILKMLKSYGVTHIELGAQSLDEEVLKKAGRGHNVRQVIDASQSILRYGFTLGLQMMIGLPGDSPQKSFDTARRIVETGAKETRIYPTLVVAGTALEKLYHSGKYQPLSLDEAVKLSAQLYAYFIDNKVKVLRTGLYPSEELNNGSGFVAGPFHPQFKELMLSELWRQRLSKIPRRSSKIIILVAPHHLNHAIGYKKSNLKALQQNFKSVVIKPHTGLKTLYYVDYL